MDIFGDRKKMRWRIIAVLLLMCLPFAGYSEKTEDSTGFNINDVIFGHIGDSYEWHITEWKGEPVAVYLPVIVYSRTSGFNVFSSKKLCEGNNYKGFQYGDPDGKYSDKVVEIVNGNEVKPLIDISITKNVLGLFFNCAVLLLLAFSVSSWYKKHSYETPPKGLRGGIEMFIISVEDDIIKPCVGENYRKFSPYLLTAFFFIFVNNIMGLVPIFPGGANLTGNIAITFVLAMFTFFMVNIFGSKTYWKDILWPDVPVWMKAPMPLMPLIEIFGLFTKPFALMIRLFANTLAGHIIILSLTCVVFITVSLGAVLNGFMSVVAILFIVFMDLMEILVAYIQAYVFTILSSIFIGMAQVKEEE
ncbi:MAG: F0F1 ATP synthase subunit A [Bacteroidales bacterium]|nr:F0F1 ATP synthase subunit A [Bacteroidales bacterium]